MDTAAGQQLSIGAAIAMLRIYFDYTDQVCAAVPEDRMDWRPDGADGGYYFSLAESIQHIADTRLQFARQLEGSDSEEGSWNTGYTDSVSPWEFRRGSLAEIMQSLKSSRGMLEPWLERPLADLIQPTAGTRKLYEERLRARREAGEDTSALEARGPSTLASVLFFLSAHEQGHRAVLQTQLRQLGYTIEKMA
ncbi:DinB family protein [bacterium]|nr:DinB family protein [bacterium]